MKRIHIASCLCMFLVLASGADAFADRSRVGFPTVVSIELTRDFYEALKEEGGGTERVLTTDPSIEYLRRIAVSSEFTVRTNLEILKRQEEILELLRSRRLESPSGPAGAGTPAK